MDPGGALHASNLGDKGNELIETDTLRSQREVEEAVGAIYESLSRSRHGGLSKIQLLREIHVSFLIKGIHHLSPGYSALDASRPWILYWILHSLSLLGESLDSSTKKKCIQTLSKCQHPDGGFCGGPGQLPHLATTYAAVCSLASLSDKNALDMIDREKMKSFLLSVKSESGGFRLQRDGEEDVRGAYTAIAIAHILNILDHDVKHGVADYIKRCQTYEGGIGGECGNEAHGGYTYCGLAALALINELEVLNLHSLIHWCIYRQSFFEGGFSGRTNKLVDGCYSFWIGGVFSIINQCASPSLFQAFNIPNGGKFKEERLHSEPSSRSQSETKTEERESCNINSTDLQEAMEHANNLDDIENHEKVERGSQIDHIDTDYDVADNQGKEESTCVSIDAAADKLADDKVNGGNEDSNDDDDEEDENDVNKILNSSFTPVLSLLRNDEMLKLKSKLKSGIVISEAEDEEVNETTNVNSGLNLEKDELQFEKEKANGRKRDKNMKSREAISSTGCPLFDPLSLQTYILVCCQALDGGLVDKPGKYKDYYHTCYCLSGFSLAQHYNSRLRLSQSVSESSPTSSHRKPCVPLPEDVIGPYSNLLNPIEPLTNLTLKNFRFVQEHFRNV